MACKACIFYSPNPKNNAIGQCRAHAPVLIMTEHGPRTQWPLTTMINWCGDHTVAADDA